MYFTTGVSLADHFMAATGNQTPKYIIVRAPLCHSQGGMGDEKFANDLSVGCACSGYK